MADSTKDILADILSELARQNDRQEQRDKEKKDNDDKNLTVLDRSAKNLKKGLPSVEGAIKKGSAAVEAAIKQSFDLQKKGLSRGLNLNKIVERQAQSNNDLAGKLTGFSNMYEIQGEKFAAGIEVNSKGLDKLALYTKLTGGDSKKLLKQMGELGFGVGISSEQQGKLSKTIMTMSQNYGMTTDELMSTIKGLDKAMPMYKILGIAPEIAEATARLGAALGQEAGDMAADVMTAFTSAEGAVLASQLGVMNERNALLNKEGDTTKNALRMVEAAGAEASRMYESYLAGTGDPAIAYKAVEDALGPAMAKSAQTYDQLVIQAKNQNKSVGEYLQSVAEEKKIKEEFNNTLENFYSTVFAPLQYAMTKVVQGITVVTGAILNNPLLRIAAQALVTLTAAVIALKAVMIARGVARVAGGAADGAAGAASGGGAAAGSGLGKGLAGIGKGIKGLGKGIGKGIGGVLKGIAKGVAAFGNTKVIKGVLAIGGLSLGLMGFAKALNMVKGVGIGSILLLAGALVVFSAAAFGLGMLLGTGIGGVAFAAGVLGIGALGVALLPLAFALSIAGPPMEQFSKALKRMSSISPLQITLLGLSLIALSAGFAALTAGSLVGGLVGFLVGGNNPLDKLIQLGKHAPALVELAKSFSVLSDAVSSLGPSLGKLTAGDIHKLAKVSKVSVPFVGSVEAGSQPTMKSDYRQDSRYTNPSEIESKRADAQRMRDDGRAPQRQWARMLEAQVREQEKMNETLIDIYENGGEQTRLHNRRVQQVQETMDNSSPLSQPAGRD
jgi:hypothetical protein